LKEIADTVLVVRNPIYMTIEQFIKLVDKKLMAKIGLGVDDLADFDFDEYFDEDFDKEDANNAADEVVAEMLEKEGYNEDGKEVDNPTD
jgi:hypothetical protein